MSKQKNVQISEELFIQLAEYFLLDKRADEEMDKLILQAMQTFMIKVADAEQRAFIKANWDMAHGIMRQCTACGILEGLDAQIALAQFINNNF